MTKREILEIQQHKEEQQKILDYYAWYSIQYLCQLLWKYENNNEAIEYEKLIKERDDEIMEMSKEIEKLWQLIQKKWDDEQIT